MALGGGGISACCRAAHSEQRGTNEPRLFLLVSPSPRLPTFDAGYGGWVLP